MMNSEEVTRTANAIAAAEAQLQELPVIDRTRRIQTVIAAQTALIGSMSTPMVTDMPSTPTLFVSNLPNETTREALLVLFQKFPGFVDVRLVPGREGIAFIDFEHETGANSAKGKKIETILFDYERISTFCCCYFSPLSEALDGFKISATHSIIVRLN